MFLLMLVTSLQSRFAEFAKHLVGCKGIIRAAAEALRLHDKGREPIFPDCRANEGLEIGIKKAPARPVKLLGQCRKIVLF